jgi:hypothetical protein
MNNKILVKKICSLNPTRYKKITLKEASDRYRIYLDYFINDRDFQYKPFTEWLESEI